MNLNKETQWIVWTEDMQGNISGTLKKTSRAAKMAYKKIGNTIGHNLKSYGFTYANDAMPNERLCVGLSPYPTENYPL